VRNEESQLKVDSKEPAKLGCKEANVDINRAVKRATVTFNLEANTRVRERALAIGANITRDIIEGELSIIVVGAADTCKDNATELVRDLGIPSTDPVVNERRTILLSSRSAATRWVKRAKVSTDLCHLSLAASEVDAESASCLTSPNKEYVLNPDCLSK